jgi:uncharacterized protein
LGKKTFEQAAGFLRVRGGHPLDDSAVHPERYTLVERIVRDLGRELRQVIGDGGAVRSIDIRRYVDDTVGVFTLEDILRELERPGRDPRRDFEAVDFRDDVRELEDLKTGMILDGVVTNVPPRRLRRCRRTRTDSCMSARSGRCQRNPADELHVGRECEGDEIDS